MEKLGYLYLNQGVWNGKGILPKEWIEESTKENIAVPRFMVAQWGDRYGYHWWLRTYYSNSTPVDSFLRTGWGGQAIIVLPSLDTVVVFTGGNYAIQDYMNPIHEIITHYILPAVQ